MSNTIMGLVFRLGARSFLKTVNVYFVGDFKTSNGTMKPCTKDFYKKVKLPTRWRAKLFAARINKQQYWRYDGTPFALRGQK